MKCQVLLKKKQRITQKVTRSIFLVYLYFELCSIPFALSQKGYSVSEKDSKVLRGIIQLSMGTVDLKTNKKNPEGEYDRDL